VRLGAADAIWALAAPPRIAGAATRLALGLETPEPPPLAGALDPPSNPADRFGQTDDRRNDRDGAIGRLDEIAHCIVVDDHCFSPQFWNRVEDPRT
jgi:hypothetical protein